MNAKLQRLFVEYADSHRHPTNRLTHEIAIPLIVFHIVAMLDWIAIARLPAFTLTAGHVAYAVAAGWYLRMHLRLGLILAGLFALCFPLGRVTPWPVVVGVAVVGWLVQLAGHVVWEKRQPAFLTNLLHALVGPMFFVATLTGDWPPRPGAARALD